MYDVSSTYLMQCYTHESLGWKAHIVDEMPAEKTAKTCAADAAGATISLLFAVLAVLYL